MKKKIFGFVLACLLASNLVQAQVPNGSFENHNANGWLQNWGNVYLFSVVMDSSGTMQTDSLIFENNSHYFYEPSTDAHSGNGALMLNNAKHAYSDEITVGAASVDEDSVFTAWGALELIPTQIRFDHLRFYYKFSPVNNDSAVARLVLYDSLGVVVGEATHIIIGTQNSYALIDAAVTYFSNEKVANYSLHFSNYYSAIEGEKKASFGTKLWIDDIELTKTTDIQGVNSNQMFKIYPNPAQNYFSVATQEKIKAISCIDMNGKKVALPFTQGKKIDCSNLGQGVYELNIETEKGLVKEKLVIAF